MDTELAFLIASYEDNRKMTIAELEKLVDHYKETVDRIRYVLAKMGGEV